MKRITDERTLDELYGQAEDGMCDAITYLRDDAGQWFAKARVEAVGGCIAAWYTVDDATHDALEAVMADAVADLGRA